MPTHFSTLPPVGLISLFIPHKEISFIEYLNFLEILVKDKFLKEIVIKLPDITAPWHQIEEISIMLKKIRASGKKISAYCKHGNLKSLFLLACADYRWADPNSNFIIQLPAYDAYFLKDGLDKLGVKIETQSVGKYKSGGFEIFTRNNFSEENKKSMLHLIQSMRKIISDVIEETPNLKKEEIKNLQNILVKQSLIHAKDIAKEFSKIVFFDKLFEERHLLDMIINKKIKTEKEFAKHIYQPNYKNKKNIKNDKKQNIQFYNELKKESKIQSKICSEENIIGRYKRKIFNPLKIKNFPSIAFVAMEGSINMGKENDSPSHKTINALAYCELIEKIKKGNEELVLLYINSPGGSADASEILYQKINQLAQTKPVIAVLGSVAASGGYYIACAANRIYASKITLTGSIGVIRIRPEISNLYKKIGIKKSSLIQDPTRDVFSEVLPLSKTTISMLAKQMQATYTLFLERVVEGRKLNKKEVEAMAQGRVFTADVFKSKKMIDGNLNINEILDLYKKEYEDLTGKKASTLYNINFYPELKPTLSSILAAKGKNPFSFSLSETSLFSNIFDFYKKVEFLFQNELNKPNLYFKESLGLKNL